MTTAVPVATDGNDRLFGTEEADRLDGLGGADRLYGHGGNDLLLGGSGDDRLYGEGGEDTLEGGDGNDTLEASFGFDRLDGGEGADLLDSGLVYNRDGDEYRGGAGNDTIRPNGSDNLIIPGAGADVVLLDWRLSPYDAPEWWHYASGQIFLGTDEQPALPDDAIDRILLSYGALELGFAAPEIHGFRAGTGGDVLDLSALVHVIRRYDDAHPFNHGWLRLVQRGDDTSLQINPTNSAGTASWRDLALLRGVVAESLHAENFTPTFSPAGTEPDQVVTGSGGADRITPETRSSGLYTGDGNDEVEGGDGNDVIVGGWAGRDTLSGGEGDDTLRGGDDDDVLRGGAGADALEGGYGNDLLLGGPGNDRLSDVSPAVPFAASLGSGRDTLRGEDGDDTLSGGGDDELDGGPGHDHLFGGGGRDTLLGGDGNDTVTVQGSGSTVDAGPGDDTVGIDPDWPGGFNRIDGGDGHDVLGNTGGTAGDDTLLGGEGDDRIEFAGIRNLVDGGAGNDTLVAGSDASGNRIVGGSGADLIVLGTWGADLVYLGGPPDAVGAGGLIDDGRDVVRLVHSYGKSSEIHGFEPGPGGDLLDLVAYAGELANGSVRFTTDGRDTILEVDPTGDPTYWFPQVVLRDVDANALTGDNLVQGQPLRVNHKPTGTLQVGGTPVQGATLQAVSLLADADGVPPLDSPSFQWRWIENGVSTVIGATGASLVLGQAQVGKRISVEARWLDGAGNWQLTTSQATTTVANVNDPPVGAVTITGTPRVGSELRASVSLADPDGMPAPFWPTYEWQADGVRIPSLGGTRLTVTDDLVGKSITASVRFRDASGHQESVTSGPTAPVDGGLHGYVYHWKSLQLLPWVQVTARDPSLPADHPGWSMLTSDKGLFRFMDLPAAGYTVATSDRPGFQPSSLSVTTADALAALRLALGQNPNADPDGAGPLAAPAPSPYQFIAADLNRDGRVNTADALAILKMAVRSPDAPAAAWHYVPDRQGLWQEATGGPALSRTAAGWTSTSSAQNDSELGFAAVLAGDVNGTWRSYNALYDLGERRPDSFPDYLQKLGAELGLPADIWGL